MYKYLLLLHFLAISILGTCQEKNPIVTTSAGTLEGSNQSGIKVFKGIPYAQAPVGDLRWKEPQPVKSWSGIKKAQEFGPNAMQTDVFGDMNFGTPKMSEDCLYLNIWTPAKTMNEGLPVLVYFHGGGFVAGSGSEPRYSGESMARNGIVSITVNYRLGIFGFLSLPELTEESPDHFSGNYGLLDQVAALRWIKDNILNFGGDPGKITIAGESAGSMSVSVLMCSPLSKDLFAQAIGSSGSILSRRVNTLQEAENDGVELVNKNGYKSLNDLRSASAEELLKIGGQFMPCIDGHFLPKSPLEIYSEGNQAHVPLLVGWNSNEMIPSFLLQGKESNFANLKEYIENRFGDKAEEIMDRYEITDDASVFEGGIELASDLFISYSSWKWSNIHEKTGKNDVFRYLYCHPRPAMVSSMCGMESGLAGGVKKTKENNASKIPELKGAVHSADIEYAMGTLPTNRVYDWKLDDYVVSDIFKSFYVNFIKNGDPNSIGLPEWPNTNNKEIPPVMNIDYKTYLEEDADLESRYKFLDRILPIKNR